jgi:cyclopropane-fatty-acyl-phospholipid synthase
MLALTLRSFDRFAEVSIRHALARADIEIGGSRPWDVRVRDARFFARVARNPGLQLGETYMDGFWECDAIDDFIERLYASGVAGPMDRGPAFVLRNTLARVRNNQDLSRAREVATAHYDLDTAIYRAMLDPSLTYTCAYYRDPRETLAQAQQNKLRMICDKLALAPGETLLDIGCGFGGLAAFAAEHYGVRVVGVTNSRQHFEVASGYGAKLPVEIRLVDYRELPRLQQRFDKISSIEMIEAVGPKNYAAYFQIAHQCLAPGGRFLIQSFISSTSQYVCNEWFDRYIFPNGVSPSFAQLGAATESTFGAPKDVHDFGVHYAPTLRAWDDNLRAAWPAFGARYDERFRRMWHFYLKSMEGVFRAEELRLCQIVYAKGPAGEVRRRDAF